MTFRRELETRSGFELFVTNTAFSRLQRGHVFSLLFFTGRAGTAAITLMIVMLVALHHLLKISRERSIHASIFLIRILVMIPIDLNKVLVQILFLKVRQTVRTHL